MTAVGDKVKTPEGPGTVESVNDTTTDYFGKKYGPGVWVKMDAPLDMAGGFLDGVHPIRYYAFKELT